MNSIPRDAFNKKNYPREMVNNLEIMGTYFVSMIYNDLYLKADEMKTNGESKSITDAYKHNLLIFMKSVESDKYYSKILAQLHQYFAVILGYTGTTFTARISELASIFLPKEYFSDITDDEKTRALKKVICNTLRSLIYEILQTDWIRIIDHHGEETNIELLKEKIFNMFILERSGMFSRFLKRQIVPKQNASAMFHMINKLRSALKLKQKESSAKGQKMLQLIKMIKNRNAQLQHLSSENAQLKSDLGEFANSASALQISQFVQPTPAPAPQISETPQFVQPTPAPAPQISETPQFIQPTTDAADSDEDLPETTPRVIPESDFINDSSDLEPTTSTLAEMPPPPPPDSYISGEDYVGQNSLDLSAFE